MSQGGGGGGGAGGSELRCLWAKIDKDSRWDVKGIYPSNMARTPAKLRENAFQTIPDISFFDAQTNNKNQNFANFDKPFTPRGWPVHQPNFGKTRFR